MFVGSLLYRESRKKNSDEFAIRLDSGLKLFDKGCVIYSSFSVTESLGLSLCLIAETSFFGG